MDSAEYQKIVDEKIEAMRAASDLVSEEHRFAYILSEVLAKKAMITYTEVVKKFANETTIRQIVLPAAFAYCLKPFANDPAQTVLNALALAKVEDAVASKVAEVLSSEANEAFQARPSQFASLRASAAMQAVFSYGLIRIQVLKNWLPR